MNDSSKSLFKRPSLISILKLTGQIGVAGTKVFFFVLLAYGMVNIALAIYALIHFFNTDFSWTNLGILASVLLLGIGFTILAFYLTYRYILLLVVRKVYRLTLQQRILISEDLIRQMTRTFSGQQPVRQKQLGVTVSWSHTVYRYYQSVPLFFQSGITQYLNRIPIMNFIIEVKEDIIAGNQALAAEKLRNLVDNFFEENILGSPNNRFTWLLLLVDILVLYGLITWGITVYS